MAAYVVYDVILLDNPLVRRRSPSALTRCWIVQSSEQTAPRLARSQSCTSKATDIGEQSGTALLRISTLTRTVSNLPIRKTLLNFTNLEKFDSNYVSDGSQT